jgi:hypothetical protein
MQNNKKDEAPFCAAPKTPGTVQTIVSSLHYANFHHLISFFPLPIPPMPVSNFASILSVKNKSMAGTQVHAHLPSFYSINSLASLLARQVYPAVAQQPGVAMPCRPYLL